MSATVLVTAAVAPLLGAPSLAAEQVSQVVLGEGATVIDDHGPFLRVRTRLDDYEGWLHRGYVRLTDVATADHWLANAAWSEGALVEASAGMALRAPHRARLILEGPERVRLPDGSAGSILSGRIRPFHDVLLHARGMTPSDWAWQQFAGASYLWGGVTGSGIDCSALVQTTFLLRGIPLPRDARQQVAHGAEVAPQDACPDDLLFFRGEETDAVTHVAMLASRDTLVHATIETGRVTRESWEPGSRAAPLRDRLVAIRRVG